MPGLVLVPLVVLVAVAGLLLAWLAATYARRRAISRGDPLVICALREASGLRWHLGLVRYGSTALDWFSLFGISLRPQRSWDRSRLDLESPLPLPPGEAPHGLIPAALLVACHHDGADFDLSLSAAPYTALRAWLEAAPPGRHLDVA